MNRIIRAVATARLVPARDWLRPRRIALVRKVARHTLLPHARLSHLADLATGLPTGAVVECGSYEGGSGAVLAVASGRPTWLFDLLMAVTSTVKQSSLRPRPREPRPFILGMASCQRMPHLLKR